MAADSITTALVALPDDSDHLTIALAAATAGARVFPVLRRNGAYVPVDSPMGAGRSARRVSIEHGRPVSEHHEERFT